MRSCFDTDREYPAYLYRTHVRPIENRLSEVILIRLEFAVFNLFPDNTIHSLGRLACRDLVICPSTQVDPGIQRFAEALAIRAADKEQQWIKAQGRWVKIRFGNPSEVDYRQPFSSIVRFSLTGIRNKPTLISLESDWMSPARAAAKLKLSVNSIRRYALKYAEEWGSNILKYKPRGSRRDMLVNVALLKNLEQ